MIKFSFLVEGGGNCFSLFVYAEVEVVEAAMRRLRLLLMVGLQVSNPDVWA